MENNKLKADSVIKDKRCLLCGDEVSNENILIDGSVYHQNCLDYLMNRIRDIDSKLESYKSIVLKKDSDLLKAQKSLQKSKGLLNQFKASLGMSHLEENSCLNRIRQIEIGIEEIKRNISQWEAEKKIKKSRLTSLYDYWPKYPPDWKERAQNIKDSRKTCEVCNSTSRLHIHHKIKISNGGNHASNNLVLLCERCHGELHHEDFSGREYVFHERVSSFARKLKLINEAISGKRKVHFKYTKFNGEKSSRILRPEQLRQVGKSLCVRGYCYLREDYRTFAIRRMENIKFVK